MTLLFCPREFGIYDSKIYMTFPNHMLASHGGFYDSKEGCLLDLCITNEIRVLWNLGIATYGSCCGHGLAKSMVNVDEKDADRMLDMGYVKDSSHHGISSHAFFLRSKHKDIHELS